MTFTRSLQRSLAGPVGVKGFDFMTRRKIYPTFRWLMDTQWRSQEQLDTLKMAQLHQLAGHAWEYSPFYRQRLDAIGWTPADNATMELLNRLPALEKHDLQSSLEDVSTISRWTSGKPVMWSTGGSTGAATRVYIDTGTRDRRQAVQFRNGTWIGVQPGDLVAYLGGTSLGVGEGRNLRSRAVAAAKRRLLLPAWDLSPRTLETYAARLVRAKPRALYGYSTAIHTFAEYLVESGRQVKLPAVLVTGEMFLPQWKRTVEKAFGAQVFNRYGSIEVGDIAHGCADCGGMHVNDENIILRLDPATGDLLITDLTTLATPFLNYRIGDRVQVRPGPAACGRGLSDIIQVDGRTGDILDLPDGGKVAGMVFSFTPGDTPGVRHYQIWQPSPHRIQVVIVCDDPFPDRQIISELGTQFQGVTIEVVRVDAIPTLPSGKRPLVVKGKSYSGPSRERSGAESQVR